MEASIWEIVLKVASIIGSLATIILGVVAIKLSLHYEKQSKVEHIANMHILSRIEASTKSTEAASSQVINPLIGMMGTFQKDALSKLEDTARLQTVQRISQKMDNAPQPLPADFKQSIIKEVTESLSKQFLALKVETAPTTLEYDWGPFIRRIHQLASENKFLSVKWLDQTKFADAPVAREELQIAIKDGILERYTIENTRNPSYPTRACKLNRQHPAVKRVFGN
jgi:hypothetical protein